MNLKLKLTQIKLSHGKFNKITLEQKIVFFTMTLNSIRKLFILIKCTHTQNICPWWFSGEDSKLPREGAPGSIPGQGTRSCRPQVWLCAGKQISLNTHTHTPDLRPSPRYECWCPLVSFSFPSSVSVSFLFLSPCFSFLPPPLLLLPQP